VSIRESLQIYQNFDIWAYLERLRADFGAVEHPNQGGAFLVEGLPFYHPEKADGDVFILGFNMVALPHALLQALIDHPKTFPGHTQIHWTQEQSLLLHATLGELRAKHKLR